ncbi:hypothetical protein [Nocardiopsis changdeensis]|uniref:hypothetical protein n=1 Tax=Nocardiopsis changdeensis TaxID=2831969 RepID=UPI003F463033
MTTGPLATVEHEFLRLDLDLADLIDQIAAFTTVRPTTALQLRDLLLSGTIARQVRDRLWRRLVAHAQEREEWMVAAVGMAMPALKACARRLCRGLDPHHAQDVQEEMLLAFVVAVRAADTTWNRLPWTLCCRARRAGIRARKDAFAQHPATAQPEPHTTATGNPDQVLARAVRAGVLTADEAEVINRTRLERLPLTHLAAERRASYWSLVKRRARAEKRLTEAIRSGRLSTDSLLLVA